VATVDASGRLTALAAGTTDIEVTYQTVSDTIRLTVSTSSLSGTVRFLGRPVAGITVHLDGPADETATSDVNGLFSFPGLSNGTYTVETEFEAAPRVSDDLNSAEVAGNVVRNVDLEVITGGYPVGPDVYEPDDVPGTAATLSLGVLQHHTLYAASEPADGGDVDFLRVSLTAGTTYEFFTAGLYETCDTVLSLWDNAATTELESNDDVVWLNSGFTFTPEADGNYLLKVEAFDEDYGVADYFVGFVAHVDADEDGWGFFDCDDASDTRYPYADDPAGDGIDQDCSGADTPTTDPDEPNDSRATAMPVALSTASLGEGSLDRDLRAANTRVLADADDIDLWSVVVPARAALEAGIVTADGAKSLDLLDTDGTTERSDLENPGDSPVTYYLRVSGAAGAYTIGAYSLGADQDRDGSYSRDWDEDRDCDDNSGAASASGGCDPAR
jgi:hypothetical protein